MASIDDQLKALNAAVAAIEKPADISGLQAAIQALQAAQAQTLTALATVATNLNAVGTKLGADTFTGTPTP